MPNDLTPQNEPDSPQSDSGLLCNPGQIRSDLKLVRQALVNNWPVSPEVRETVLSRLVGIVEMGDDASAIKASGCILQADRLNQADRHKELEAGRKSGPSSLTQININALDDVYSVIERLKSPAKLELPAE